MQKLYTRYAKIHRYTTHVFRIIFGLLMSFESFSAIVGLTSKFLYTKQRITFVSILNFVRHFKETLNKHIAVHVDFNDDDDTGRANNCDTSTLSR